MIKTAFRPAGHAALRSIFLGFVLSSLTGSAIASVLHVSTDPSGINNAGIIVGDYRSSAFPQPNSFIDTKYTHFVNFFDPLAAGATIATGINDQGKVVGTYYTGSSAHGFLYSGGNFQTIDRPNSHDTSIFGINNSGYITGYSCQSAICQSFEFMNGAFLTISDPLATNNGTSVGGINNLGEISGTSDIAGVAEGFVYSGGSFTHFSVPGAIYTSAVGINDLDSVVGNFIATAHGNSHGFLYSGGNFTTIDFPGAGETFLGGINNDGAITGFALDVQIGRRITDAGFVYQNGVFTVISDLGHSNPIPEPATWTLMIAGLGGLGAALRQSRRVRRQAA